VGERNIDAAATEDSEKAFRQKGCRDDRIQDLHSIELCLALARLRASTGVTSPRGLSSCLRCLSHYQHPEQYDGGNLDTPHVRREVVDIG
jgi:hypothetical protein